MICIKELYKSTYKSPAFKKGKTYEILHEDDYVWVLDDSNTEFSFQRAAKARNTYYIFEEYFR